MARPAASSPGSTPAAGRGSPMCRDDAPYLIVVRLSHAAGVRAVRYRRASIPRRPAYGRVNFSTFALSLFVVVSGVRLVACFFSGEGEHYRADEARDEDERGSWVDCHQARCLVV